jgi:hypothetical protein
MEEIHATQWVALVPVSLCVQVTMGAVFGLVKIAQS